MACSTWTLIATYSLFASCQAYSNFKPNCTVPTQSYNYVAAPNTRSTLEIAWSSLATIIACTYSVLHLNVPEQRDGRDPGWRGDLKWRWKGIWPSIKWSLITIVAPEAYFLIAIDNFLEAKHCLRELESLPPHCQPHHTWTRAHAFYVCMGGFAIRCNTAAPPSTRERSSWSPRNGQIKHLDNLSFPEFLEHGQRASRIPAEDEILDRSKSDAFAKSIALLQIAYFTINVIARVAYGLPVAPLEVGAIAFTACSTLAYGLLFCKPKSVSTVVIVAEYEGDVPVYITEDRCQDHVANDGNWRSESVAAQLWIIALASVLFGAIHVAAWDLHFPSPIDMWLWRVASCVSAGIIVFSSAMYHVLEMADDPYGICYWIAVTTTVLYTLARFVLMGEMVRTLFYLPPGAFIGTWAAGFPHVG